MITDKLRPHRDRLLLATIFVVLTCSTIAWTLKDKTPPAWDPADHISAAYDYYHTLAHLDLREFAREFFVYPHYYAPMVHLVSAAVFLVLGASRVTGICVNLISLAALIGSLYWIARRLYGGAQGETSSLAGVVAALLASCYHFNAWLMHDAFLDFPLTAIVTVSFAALISAGDFGSRRKALIFGAAAGVGMLTKQTFPFFFLLPAAYVFFRVLASRNLKAVANLALAALVAASIAAVWYGPHFNDVLAIYRVNQQAAVNENEAPVMTLMSNLFYVHALLSAQMQVPFGILFVCGLIYSLARRRGASLMLYLWLASGLLAFTFIANKDIRYTVPVLPAAALISVCWLGRLKPAAAGRAARSPVEALKVALGGAIVAWAFVSFFNAQWPKPGMGYYIDTPRFRWMVYARNYFGFDHRPLADDWSVPEIVQTVAGFASQPAAASSAGRAESARTPLPEETVSPQTHSRGEVNRIRQPVLGVIVNLPHLNPSSIALYARLLSPGRAGPPLLQVEWLVTDSSVDQIERCDYLLVRTGLDRAEWVAPVERYAEQLIRRNPARFTEVASFPIPLEQAEALVYRCEKD